MTDRWLLVLRGAAEGTTVKVAEGERYVKVPAITRHHRPPFVTVNLTVYDSENPNDILDVTAAVTGAGLEP